MEVICAACGEKTPEGRQCVVCGQPPLLRERYRLLSVLGKGALGTTYAAENVNTRQSLAIKEVLLRRVSDEKARQLLDREAALLKQLRHRAIPRGEETFIAGTGKHRAMYLIQERIHGQTLAEEMKNKRYRPDEVVDIAEELLRVLSYLQHLSPPVIHRDLKPANIMRRERDGSLVLIDFGSVRDALKDPDLGGSTVAGTFGYMAPEQLMGEASPASDLYGLGATMVNLLSRKDPQRMMSLQGLDWKPHLSVHPALEGFLERLLAPDPQARPRNAAEALRLLRKTREEMKVAPPVTVTAANATPPPVGKAPPQVAAFAVSGAGAAVVLIAGVAMALLMVPSPEPAPVVPQPIPTKPEPLPQPEPPKPPPTPVAPTPPDVQNVWIGSLPPRGNTNAAVELVVFTDFQCPFCDRLEDTLEDVRAGYSSAELTIYMRDMPLSFHKLANGAHLAARCANEQRRFWEMHDVLFENNKALQPDNLRDYARRAGVSDLDTFDTCMKTARYQDRIDRDIEDAKKLGARGTPTMFINGEKLVGAQPKQAIINLIDKKLAEVR